MAQGTTEPDFDVLSDTLQQLVQRVGRIEEAIAILAEAEDGRDNDDDQGMTRPPGGGEFAPGTKPAEDRRRPTGDAIALHNIRKLQRVNRAHDWGNLRPHDAQAARRF